MEVTFCISVNIKVGSGYELLGKFILGSNSAFASGVFRQLKGSTDANNNNPIHLDFMESRNGLPVHLEVISCNLNELAENTKIITRERFKMLNMEST